MKFYTSVTAGGIILNKKRNICLVNDKVIGTSTWSLPKGRMKKEEKLLETAKREIYEETGLKNITFIKKLGIIRRPSNIFPLVEKEIHVFLFTTNQNKLHSLFNDQFEYAEPNWFTYDEAVDRLTSEKDREFLKLKRKEIFQSLKK